MSQNELLELRPVRSQRERQAERAWREASAAVDRERQALETISATLTARRKAYRQERAAWLADQRERTVSLRDVQRREECERAVLLELQHLEAQLAEQHERLAQGQRDCEQAQVSLTSRRRALERLDALLDHMAKGTA
ncbi:MULTISPECIES: hypothetical protein [unclassified Pseudomonas]|uniref:hypothetical protein n=1 Tax=unclassified Pseudomonas TaxID=196821 RepID=UPI00235FDC45|nr:MULTISPECIES: hypothetical protein [unclassified Pseudomonas]